MNPTKLIRTFEIILLGLLVTLAYVSQSTSFILGGDNAEFVLLFAKGGVSHPSGYPLYILYLRSMSWLPLSAVQGAAIATAQLGIATAIILHFACRAWGASFLASSLAVILFALSPLAWLLSTAAEVFVLNALIAVCLLWIAGPKGPLTGTKRIAILGLIAGLGLSNHLSCIFLLPIGIGGIIQGLRENCRPLLALSFGVLHLLLGLLPYITLPIMARSNGIVWGDPTSITNIFNHFSRGDYGTSQLAVSENSATPWEHILSLLTHTMSDLLWVFPIIAVLGILFALIQKFRKIKIPDILIVHPLLILITFGTTGPLFVSMFNLQTTGLDLEIIERFYLLPQLFVCVLFALSLSYLLPEKPDTESPKGENKKEIKIVTTDQQSKPLLDKYRTIITAPLYRTLIIISLALCSFALNIEKVQYHHNPSVENYLKNSLTFLPQNSIILGTGDHRLFGFAYFQQEEHLRTDILYIDPIMLHYDWYREQINSELASKISGPQDNSIDTSLLVEELFLNHRPVFMTNIFSEKITKTFPTFPLGSMIRIPGPLETMPAPYELEIINFDLFEKYSIEECPPEIDGWSIEVRHHYARPFLTLSHIFNQLKREPDSL